MCCLIVCSTRTDYQTKWNFDFFLGVTTEDTKTATILMSSDEEENIKESKKATRKSSVASITSYIKVWL